MMDVLQNFLYPLSPVLAMMGGGTLLIGVECFTSSRFKELKFWLALIGAMAALTFTLLLWKTWPSFFPLGSSEGGVWLLEFNRMYHLDNTSLGFFAAISVFTSLSLVFLGAEFYRSDILAEIFALTLFIASGMMILVSADSLLMVFLGLELLSLPTYVLVGLRRHDRNSCEAALKYFLFGSFATVLLVFGIALLYAQFGTLNIPRLTALIAELSASPSFDSKLLIAGLSLILIAIGFKVGLVPFHMWIPDVYQGAPAAVTGFMGSAVKLAGFGLTIRLFCGMFLPVAEKWTDVLSLLAMATMLVGNLAALAQDNLKRLFAYSSISHAGFLMLGIVVLPQSPATLNAIYYYLVVYGLMFLGLFAILAMLERSAKNTDIFQLSGMGFTHPLLSLCLAIFSLSAAGIPPTAGFFAKYFVFIEAVRAGRIGLVILALLASLIGVYYYLRVIVYLYMKENREVLRLGLGRQRLVYVCILLCALSLLFFAVSPEVLRLIS